MIPGKHNTTITKGDTFRLFFRARQKNPDGTPGDYYDFTGMFPMAQLRDNTGALVADFEATLGNQVAFPGSIQIRLGPVSTAALPVAANYKYDVQVSSVDPTTLTDDDDNDTFLGGVIAVEDDVTEVEP